MRALHAALVVVVVVGVLVPFAVASTSSSGASLDRVGTWQAPANETSLDDVTDVRSAIEDGSIGRATGVDQDDTLVIGMKISGFADAVSEAEGSNETERFLSALSAHGDLAVTQSNPGTHQRSAEIHVLDGTGVRVFSDDANESYYIVVDLGDVRVTRGEDGDEVDLEYGPYEFVVQAELAANSSVTEVRQRAAAPIEPRSASINTSRDGKVHVRPTQNLTLSGSTNVGSGWPVTIVLAGEDDPDTAANESFRRTRDANVELAEVDSYYYESVFDVTFERETIPPAATNVTVDARLDGDSLLDEPIPVDVAERRASVAVDDVGEHDRSTAVNVTTSLSAGGFLVLHEESADGHVVGHTEYLDAGTHNVSVYTSEPTDARELVVLAHHDDNHNEWFDGPDVDTPYAEENPGDVIELGLTDLSTPNETTSSSPNTRTEPASSSFSVTEFGGVAVALAFLVGLGLVARRRW